MPRQGNMNPGDPVASLVSDLLPATLPSGIKFGMPFIVIDDLSGDDAVNGIQNPSDSDCLVAAIVNVVTVDATETIDVGVDTDGTNSSDTLIDGGDLATAGVYSSMDSAHKGANGLAFRLLDKKGGTNDYVTHTGSTGTDTAAGQVILILIPINE